jgi:hypothetical protein
VSMRSPRSVRRALAFVALGAVLAVALLVLHLRFAHGAACHPDCGPNGEDWDYQSDIVCGKYRGELWTAEGRSWIRFPERHWREGNLIVKFGDLYYKGKKCRVVLRP